MPLATIVCVAFDRERAVGTTTLEVLDMKEKFETSLFFCLHAVPESGISPIGDDPFDDS